MSINKTQIDSLIKRNCGISSDNTVAYPVADMTADENLAIDRVFDLIFKSSGRWQFDDSNHTDYPFITTNLVLGQRDYTFTTDEQGNLILDIYKVMVKTESGIYQEIYPIDQQTDVATDSLWDGQNNNGVPYRYDKTANGIFLDAIPSYNSTNGLKIFINREGSYFTTSDNTKKPGFAGIFHEYIALYPSYLYAMRNALPNKNDLKRDIEEMETKIQQHYRDRSKDETLSISGEQVEYV